ncbi:MAG TPA: hypothetical protein PLP31_03910 [Thermoanaerobaculaceae bacterium]|nr:hypothetical protein [Thermoanaerobaculaceae bacterium]
MRIVLTTVALALAFSGPAQAQFTQYFAPGSLGETEDPLRRQIEQAMERARWRLGPIRLEPWIGIRNLGYIDNVYGSANSPVSDFTVSAGAGLRAYLPVGSKTFLFARALPEYVWWKDLDYRRAWTGRYSAGGFVFFNRLTLEGYVNRLEQQSYINAELETPITHQLDSTQLSIELRLLRRLSFVVSGSRSELRIDTEGLDPQLGHWYEALERDEDVLRVGLRYTFSENLAITIGGQRSEADFTQPIYDRSNVGDGLYTTVSFTGKRFALSVNGARYTVEPKRGSQFATFESTAGQASLGYKLSDRVRWQLYGGRSLVYSITGSAGYYTDTRVGTGLSASVGRRIATRVHYEEGKFEYPGSELSSFDRDYTGWGAGISTPVFRGASLGVSWTRNEYRGRASTTRVDRIQTSLSFAGGGLGWW